MRPLSPPLLQERLSELPGEHHTERRGLLTDRGRAGEGEGGERREGRGERREERKREKECGDRERARERVREVCECVCV